MSGFPESWAVGTAAALPGPLTRHEGKPSAIPCLFTPDMGCDPGQRAGETECGSGGQSPGWRCWELSKTPGPRWPKISPLFFGSLLEPRGWKCTAKLHDIHKLHGEAVWHRSKGVVSGATLTGFKSHLG